MKDPIVKKVRTLRQKHAAQFNYNIRKIAEDLNKRQKQFNRSIVSFSPKPVIQKTGTRITRNNRS